MKIAGQCSFGTGDINLSAALLSIGINPDPLKPVELIASEDGHDYTRFHIEPQSEDFQYRTADMMAAWDDPAGFRRENPQHPFAIIMDFIGTRPRGCSSCDDWIRHAAAFLGLSLDATWKSFRSIGMVCEASPESPVSYALAFIRNRIDLIAHAKRMEKAGNFKNFQTHGKAVGMIPSKAPKRIRNYLLAALHQ